MAHLAAPPAAAIADRPMHWNNMERFGSFSSDTTLSPTDSERPPKWTSDAEKFGSFSSDTTIDFKEKDGRERELDEVDRKIARRGKIRDFMTVAGGFMAVMATSGLVNSIGLLQTYWENNQLKNYPAQTVGWIAGTGIFLNLLVPVVAGPLFDRYGHTWLMVGGSLIFLLGVFVMGFFDKGFSESATFGMMVLAWGVCCGTGTGLISTAVSGLICCRFDRRRGLANGFSSLGGSVGGVMWPIILRLSLNKLGWGWATRSMDALAFLLLVIGNVLTWDSADIMQKRKLEVATGKASKTSWTKCVVDGARCFRRPEFVWLVLSLAMFQFVIMGIAGTLPSWGEVKGFDSSLFFYVVAVVNAGSGAGRVGVCSISDWIGRFNSIILANILAIAVSFGLFYNVGKSVELLYTFAAIWGFVAGAGLGMMTPLIGELCEAEEFGRYFSAASTITSIAGLLCVPLSARMLNTFGPQNHVLFFGTVCVMALVAMMIARFTYTKYSLKLWTKV